MNDLTNEGLLTKKNLDALEGKESPQSDYRDTGEVEKETNTASHFSNGTATSSFEPEKWSHILTKYPNCVAQLTQIKQAFESKDISSQEATTQLLQFVVDFNMKRQI